MWHQPHDERFTDAALGEIEKAKDTVGHSDQSSQITLFSRHNAHSEECLGSALRRLLGSRFDRVGCHINRCDPAVDTDPDPHQP